MHKKENAATKKAEKKRLTKARENAFGAAAAAASHVAPLSNMQRVSLAAPSRFQFTGNMANLNDALNQIPLSRRTGSKAAASAAAHGQLNIGSLARGEHSQNSNSKSQNSP